MPHSKNNVHSMAIRGNRFSCEECGKSYNNNLGARFHLKASRGINVKTSNTIDKLITPIQVCSYRGKQFEQFLKPKNIIG